MSSAAGGRKWKVDRLMEMSSKRGSRGRHSTSAVAAAVVAAPASAEPQLHRRLDGGDDALPMAAPGRTVVRGDLVRRPNRVAGVLGFFSVVCWRGLVIGDGDLIQTGWFDLPLSESKG